jgi:ATP adenylyltransferase
MDFLWTPWRYSYVTRATKGGDPPDCVFYRIANAGAPDRQSLLVHRAKHNFVVLNRLPDTSGHIAKLAAASEETGAEMMDLTRRKERVLDKLYEPDGLNIGTNIGRAAGAGVAGHLHMHALPRWAADSNFAMVIGETRVLPAALEVTWERARAEFERS